MRATKGGKNLKVLSPHNKPRPFSQLYKRYTGKTEDNDKLLAVLAGFRKRQRQLVTLWMKGYGEPAIAQAMSISRRSVRTYLERIARMVERRIGDEIREE